MDLLRWSTSNRPSDPGTLNGHRMIEPLPEISRSAAAAAAIPACSHVKEAPTAAISFVDVSFSISCVAFAGVAEKHDS